MADQTEEKSLTLVNGEGSKILQQARLLAGEIQLLSGNMLDENDAMLLGSMFQSGLFKDVDSLSKAVTKAAFGKRIGIDPMTAVTSLNIIDGKPALEAQAIRNTCVMAGYDIVPIVQTDEEVVLEWHYKGKLLGTSKFTKKDAMLRGYVDPTCEKWPHDHNVREIEFYNKYKKPQAGWDKKQGCKCKDNWISMPDDMLFARATTRGSRRFANHALKQEVYDVEELRDSNIREDTTPVDVARLNIEKSTTIEELQAITKELTPAELEQVLEDIHAKTKEILNNEPKTEAPDSRSATA